MADVKTWTIAENTGLAERGNPLFGTSPLEFQNAQTLTEGVLEMRQGLSGETLVGSGLTGPVLWCGRHITNTGVDELWAAANNLGTAALARRVSAGAWAPVTFSDTANAANLLYMQGVSMDGKFFLFYDSDVNRLHVWDGTSVRRVGLIAATAPTVAQMGVGALSFTRFYRQRNTVQVAGVTTQRSEASSAVTIAIVNRLGVTVTKGAASGDGETHWEVEAAAAADGPWYRIATTVVGTTTYDDTSASISTADPTDEAGAYVPPPSAKYGSTDGITLLMTGAWETTAAAGQTVPKRNRVWFTPPLGASDISDDERIPDTAVQKNWLDIGDAGPTTALDGPVYGETIVFKERSVSKLTPTGNVEAPYALSVISDAMGAVDARLVRRGELGGIPSIFFADTNAVYALTSGGITCISEPIGRDLRAITIQADPGLLLYDSYQRMLFLQTATEPASQAGSYKSFTFDTAKSRWAGFSLGGATGGWILGTSILDTSTILGGNSAAIWNGTFAGTTSGNRRLFVCGQFGAPAIFLDLAMISSWGATVAVDNSNSFTSIARFRKVLQPGSRCTVMAPTVMYRNTQGANAGTLTLTLALTRDFDERRAQSKTLEATDEDNGIAVRQVTFEGLSSTSDVSILDVSAELSYDGAPYESVPTPAIDAIIVPYIPGEALAR